MIFLLTVGLIVLGVILMDTRSRVKMLEARLRGEDLPARPDWERQPARIIPDTPAAAVPETVEIAPPEALQEEAPPAQAEDFAEAQPAENPAEPPAPPAPPAKPRIGFEDLFGRKLPIWAGGITLAIAGVLLVKYSIDAGLLSPLVRVVLGLLFGVGLIAGAELALRQEHRVQDARVRQSLSGAGIATFYASTLAAANLYQLIGPGPAFVGLAAVTALAMGLSLRFGAPTALLGLAGGLAAPALVSAGPPNVPLLCSYLGLAIGGLCALSRKQRWAWLGVSALVGGAGWGAILIVTGGLDFAATLSLGLLVMALGILLPALLLLSERRALVIRGGAVFVAAAQIAALVATGGFGALQWALYGLLSIAIVWLSGREQMLRPVTIVGMTVGLLLAALWPNPDFGMFVPVMLAMAAIYGGSAMMRLWRPLGSVLEAGQIAGMALAGFAIAFFHYWGADGHLDMRFALLALAAAMLPASGAVLGWPKPARRGDARFAVLSIAAAVLVAIAAALGAPEWMLPVLVAALASLMLLLSEKAEDGRIGRAALGFLLLSVICLIVTDPVQHQLGRLVGDGAPREVVHALIRWGAVAAAAVHFAWRTRGAPLRAAVQAGATVLGYGAMAQIVPHDWLGPASAAMAVGLTELALRRPRTLPLLPAMATAMLLTALWALEPLVLWFAQGVLAIGGEPMLASNLPGTGMVVHRLAIPAVLLGMVYWRGRSEIEKVLTLAAGALAGVMGAVTLHIVYKQLFHIDDAAMFIRFGLAERTLWEILLIGAGYAVARLAGQRQVVLGLIAAALAHNIWFSLVLHDPLWTEQAVGPVPLLNLLVPAFGLSLLGFWLAGRIAPELYATMNRGFDLARMVVVLLFAFASLRQLFSGTILVGTPIGQVENIAWSVAAIGLAGGFLVWGIRRGLHDWRIASLILMLAAVAKVFLLDASGLDGLLRITSFLALGFSLIGIGWLYSRFLRLSPG